SPDGARKTSSGPLPMLQSFAKPIKSFVLHGDRPAMRFIVESAYKLAAMSGRLIQFGDSSDRLLHAFQRKQTILGALLHEQCSRCSERSDLGQVHPPMET